ncbi:MAG: hypothetical protein K8T26_14085 [Lentisphaerae bacterium]|nr:hypothetical protein [Lentisphaerota bacterium]
MRPSPWWTAWFVCLFVCLSLTIVAGAQDQDAQGNPGTAGGGNGEPPRVVAVGPNGRLVYAPDSKGNIVPDFSTCGYRGGGVAIPDVPVVATLEPAPEGDDTKRIQAALDALAQRAPDTNGVRGALLLKKGIYRVEGTLQMSTSGMVLRGEGQYEDGSVIRGLGDKWHVTVAVAGSDAGSDMGIAPQPITDAYVPAGTHTFAVESTAGFAAGDPVVVVRLAKKAWLDAVGGSPLGWNEEGYTYRYERVITAVESNRVTLDAPVVEPIERALGGGLLCKYTYPGRIREAGVENLRFDTGGIAVQLANVEDAWVRHVTAVRHIYSCAMVTFGARRVTVQDCAYLDPIGPIKGGYRYGFNVNGQQALIQRCYARNGRHDFVMHNMGRGPNVFLDCLAEKANGDSGPHHRWSVATLFDNVAIEGNGLTAKNAGTRGTGHGWTGAQMVFWNCRADYLNIQDPPTAQNYCIGCKGKKSSGSLKEADGHWESHRTRVEPRSLYLVQLKERLGADAVKRIATPAQLDGTIATKLRTELGR